MLGKLSGKISHFLKYAVKLIILVSFVVSQLYVSEVFLHKKGLLDSTINIAKADAADPWYDTGYSYRKRITIDHTKVPNTDQYNFPLLVSLADNSLKTIGNGGKVSNSNGYDVIFTSQDGTVKLDHETEGYNGTTGAVAMWVKVPVLSHSVDTIIYIYYGNSSINTSQEDKTGVWDDGGDDSYRMVQHMTGAPANGVAGHLDSTAYSNNGTPYNFNSINTSTTNGTGKFSGADVFDGSDDYVLLANNANSLNTTDKLTVSAWIFSSNYGRNYQMIVVRGESDAGPWQIRMDASQKIQFMLNGAVSIISTATLSNGNWYHIVATYDKTLPSQNMKIYVNKALSATSGTYQSDLTNTGSVRIGKRADGWNFLGTIDEVRISNTARSADWVAAEFNNQSYPYSFYFLGIEESVSGGSVDVSPLSSWYYRKAITIDHTKVSGSNGLSAFPVLISLASDSELASHAKSNGDDIMFVPSSVAWNAGTQNDRLAHEIENFDSGSGALKVWVKIPSLSPTEDTVIYMYYGNNSSAPQDNRNIVWESTKYKAVQHMSGAPANGVAGHLDSTIFGNNGTPQNFNGTASSTTNGTGKIMGADVFDGTDDYIGISNNSGILDFTDKLTVSAWVFSNNYGKNFQMIAVRGENDSGPWQVRMDGSSQRAQFVVDGVVSISSTATLSNGTWNYVVATYDQTLPTQNMKIYVNDGAPVSSGLADAGLWNSGNTRIGGRGDGWNFVGTIDEVRISNIALSADWIKTEYNNQNLPSSFYALGSEQDSIPAILTELTPVSTPTTDVTPSYVFNSTKAGDITYGGDCSSSTSSAAVGSNTIVFNTLSDGAHSNCTIKVTNLEGNDSNVLPVSSFTVDTTSPSTFLPSSPSGIIPERNPTFSWNSATDTNGISKYQLYIDSVLNKDNILTISTTASSELTCGEHTWQIKAFDTLGNSTLSTISSFTISCGGGFIPAIKPSLKDITITILDNGQISLSGIPADINQIAVSSTSDFGGVSWEDMENKDRILKRYINANKLYIRFRTIKGAVSDTLTWGRNSSIGNSDITLQEGDIVKIVYSPDVYIIKYKNGKQYKRLILSPSVFNSYRHLKWSNLKIISQFQLDSYITSNLVQVKGDSSIYELTPEGDTGRRKALDVAKPYDSDSVYEINSVDRGSYRLEN